MTERNETERRRRALRIVLRVYGILLCLTLVGVVLPMEWMQRMAGWFAPNWTAWPANPIFDYAVRVMALLAGWAGVALLLAARDPVRYRVFVDLAALGFLALLAATLIFGPVYGLPPAWYLLDGVFYLVGAALLAILRERGESPPA